MRSKAHHPGTAVAALVGFALVFGAGAAFAANGPPDFTLVLPAGLACNGFDLQIEGWNSEHGTVTLTKDHKGNIRVITAGVGSELRFTNLSTGATFGTRSNGAVNRTTLNPDGSSDSEVTGHNVLILFPTDSPPGPSTTLYVGRVEFHTDAFFNTTVLSTSGKSTDICALLD